MRKEIKLTLLMSMLMVCMFGLSACVKKTADEEQIKQELESENDFHFLKEGEHIEEIVIEKRQTEKKEKTDTVWCIVVTSDSEISCQKNIVLSYGLYDKAGWMLDDIEVESKEKWIMTPLKGVEESALLTLLSGRVLVIDGEEWQITQENLSNVRIEKQQTDLEQQTDKVTISFVLDDKLERAEGQIEVLFTFSQKWKYDSIISKDEFSVSLKQEYALNVSEDDLIAKVTEIEFPVGETKQTISVGGQEISDFKIDAQESESKGSRQIYRCSYKVNKSKTVLEAETLIVYTYQEGEGWNGSVYSTVSQIVSTDIAGTWIGTYLSGFWEEKGQLYISEMKDDGTVTAVYEFTSGNQSVVDGSYELSGTWDQENLKLWLEAGEWIVKPVKIRLSNDKDNITAKLNIEDDRLELRAQGNWMKAVRSN